MSVKKLCLCATGMLGYPGTVSSKLLTNVFFLSTTTVSGLRADTTMIARKYLLEQLEPSKAFTKTNQLKKMISSVIFCHLWMNFHI